MPHSTTCCSAAQAVAAGPGVGGMPFLMRPPGFPAPAYAVPAPGHAIPQHLRMASVAASHQRGAGPTRPQAALQSPTAGRQQRQVLTVPRRARSGVLNPGAQPRQASVVPMQRQRRRPRCVEHPQGSDDAAAQGPSQPASPTRPAGAAQPWGALGLQQGSAQPTPPTTCQDRDGQVPVQAPGPQQVRAASACAFRSPAASASGGHQHSAGQGQEQQQRAPVPPAVQLPASIVAAPRKQQVCQCRAWPYPARFAPRTHIAWPLHVLSTSRMSLQALTSGQLKLTLGRFPASPDSFSEA